MDELKKTPENNRVEQTSANGQEALDALLKWADAALSSFDEPAKRNEEAPRQPREGQVSPEKEADTREDAGSAAQYADDENDEDYEDCFEDIDYNDDELLRGYVWDEDTGRLYKLDESRRRPVMVPLFLVGLLAATLGAAIIKGTPILPATGRDNSILSQEHQIEQETAAPLPSDQQQEVSSEGTVRYIPAEIIWDGDTVAVLASIEAAQSLLEDVKAYFHESVTGEGEKESVFEEDVEVRPLPNDTDKEIESYEEAFKRFTSSSSPIKIRTTLTVTQTETLPFDTRKEKDSTLVEGTRIVASMGREGHSTTYTYNVYINGDRSSTRSGSDTETVKPMDMLIYEGGDKPDIDEDSPGRHEGKKGPDQGELTFIAPIEGDISLNFGQYYGVLHLGLDYEPEKDAVIASEGGTVVTLLERGGYGLMLEIDHGSGFVTRYAHLDSASVAPGDTVSQGQTIAAAGSSGNAEEKTLHFEIRVDGIPYNPRYYLD